MDGILGLAFGKLSSMSEKSVLDRIKEIGLIKSARFSLFLSGHRNQPSELLLDGINNDYYQGNWTTLNISSNSVNLMMLILGILECKTGFS